MSKRSRQHSAPGAAAPPCSARGFWRRALLIWALAFALRLIHLIDYTDHPAFYAPVVDSMRYDALALSALTTGRLSGGFFMQSPFYPLWLTVVYGLLGRSILLALVLQAALGAVNCAMVAGVGEGLFGRRIATGAGLVCAFYGPLIFYGTSLVGSVWEVFWTLAILGAMLQAESRAGRLAPPRALAAAAGLGILGGIAVLARPTALPVWAACGGIVLWRARRRGQGLRHLASCALVALTALALPLLPIRHLSERATGLPSFLPHFGALNLYIGNGPGAPEMQRWRPGADWDRLLARPRLEGHLGLEAEKRWFLRQTLRHALTHPTDFARNLGVKTLEFFSTREIPNSVGIYHGRSWSFLLRVLVWRIGGFGFPFGVVLPLAAAGLWSRRRRLRAPLWAFLALYPAGIVAVHTCARYRMPAIPLAVLLACAGAADLARCISRRVSWRCIAPGLGLGLLVAVVGTISGPFARETIDYETELHYCLGIHALRRGEYPRALEHCRRALEGQPLHPDAHINAALAILWGGGDPALARQHLERAIEIAPDYDKALQNLAVFMAEQGRASRARDLMERAWRANPMLFDDRADFEAYCRARGMSPDDGATP